MPVIDASVYVALLNRNEPAHPICWRWFEQAQLNQDVVAAPMILLAEVAAALSRGTNSPELAQAAVAQIVEQKLIELVPVTRDLGHRAAKIAAEYRIRGCDAVYVALAQLQNDRLITLDRQQLERGSAVVSTQRPNYD
ncbi:MAG: PIN domain-containing protein [Chloroflexi bacterium]|nr:MAG: PIN domain-containing protein [Chloroflexota bacterium]